MNLHQQILKRASEKGLTPSCIQAPCGQRFWSFHRNADDIIYCSRYKTARPWDAVIHHIPEARVLWFLDAYDQEHYDNLLHAGDFRPGVQKKM